ncbi:MAG TPA: cupin domain-containing protein [Steroidobacteraceae bacterium]
MALLFERMAMRMVRRDLKRSTLGDLLYADKARDRTPEARWVALVRGVAERDQNAFQTLYLWTHRLIITLIMGITDDWFATEELAVDVFEDLWRGAATFDPLGDTVVGWIMNQARLRALGGARGDDPRKSDSPTATQVFEMMVDGATDSLPFSASLWSRITERITAVPNEAPLLKATVTEHEAGWEQPAPGIYCKILATEIQRGRVSMLVRLAPGIEYPPHIHAGVETLHLLQGELWIDGRKLHRGDYNHGEPGCTDKHVWSETGCTCILVTSARDIIG